MRLAAYLTRLVILATAVIAFAYSGLPIGLRAVCIACVLTGWLSSVDY